MSALRSLLFNIAFFGWTALLCIGGIPLLAASAGWIVAGQRLWAWGVIGLLRLLIGTDYQVSGRENLPDGPFVIAAKHQSAWETIIFFLLIDRPAYVLKKELLAIPLYGWYARRGGHIAVDRKAGAKALRLLLEDSRRAIADGMVPVIFPQGTRTAPGTHLPYQPGIAALYRGLDLPVVPACSGGVAPFASGPAPSSWNSCRRSRRGRTGPVSWPVSRPPSNRRPTGWWRKAYPRKLENYPCEFRG